MKPETWTILDEKFDRFPVLKARSVDYAEIDATFTGFGIALPRDYREFIHRYGGAIVGPLPIIGLRKASPMGRLESSALETTKHFRKQGWRGVNEWLVISIDLAGNPIGLDNKGCIWIFDHDSGIVEKIADDFEGFLRTRCLKID